MILRSPMSSLLILLWSACCCCCCFWKTAFGFVLIHNNNNKSPNTIIIPRSRSIKTSTSSTCSTPTSSPSSSYTTSTSSSTSSSSLHCICINCQWVTSCQAYHFVETKHEQPHMTLTPTFEPRDGNPTIEVNIRTSIRNEQDDRQKEIHRMWKEHAAETERAKEKQQKQQQQQQQQAASAASSSKEEIKEGGEIEIEKDKETLLFLVGEATYDFSPVTTYEYDVVACQDFIEDIGCWVRNMPEEIRKANPDFVPS